MTTNKRVFISIAATAFLAVGALAFKKSSDSKDVPPHKLVNYYYRFIGTHGQESDTSKWVQLTDEDAYDQFICSDGEAIACKIKNTTNVNGRPSSVPLTTGGLPDPTMSPNIAVKNRSN